MRKVSRVVFLKDDKILLIHRFKNGKEYYVAPGGGIEEGETPEEAAIREAKEETSLDIVLGKKISEVEESNVHTKLFFVESFEGKLELGGPEAEKNGPENSYSLEWFPVSNLKDVLLYPESLVDDLVEFISSH